MQNKTSIQDFLDALHGKSPRQIRVIAQVGQGYHATAWYSATDIIQDVQADIRKAGHTVLLCEIKYNQL